MTYLLDTDMCSYLMRDYSPALNARIGGIPARSVSMSVVSQGELRAGIERSGNTARLLERLDRLNDAIGTRALPVAASLHYAAIRVHLQRKGTPIGPNDLWIAAHALAEELTLVTNNTREFRRVPGLKLANWME